MLVERCEEGEAKKHAKSGGKDKKCADLSKPTHYLLILGYQVENGRRGRKAYTLLVKDPMEGDELLTARLEANPEGRIELRTTQSNGTSALDRFRPLEACHFRGRRNVTAGMTSDEETEEETTNLNATTESSLSTKHKTSAEIPKIHTISPSETMQIREQVLWPGKPEKCVLPEDDAGLHFGAFVQGSLVGIISIFFSNDNKSVQFRKFAVLETMQGQGIGSQLLTHIILTCRERGAATLWCDARAHQEGLYERKGFHREGQPFEKYAACGMYVKMQMRL